MLVLSCNLLWVDRHEARCIVSSRVNLGEIDVIEIGNWKMMLMPAHGIPKTTPNVGM